MSKRQFGDRFYTLEDWYERKPKAVATARKLRATGKRHVRVARTGKNVYGRNYWGVYVRGG